MSTATEEIIHVCESLSPDKRVEVADFARFLLEKQSEAEWDSRLADPQPRPRLEAFVKEALAEGSGPLDFGRP